MTQTKTKKPQKYLTREQKIYCFLLVMSKISIDKFQAKLKARDVKDFDNKALILWLLKESKSPLSSQFISCLLNIPVATVDHNLMVLKCEFNVIQNVKEQWIAIGLCQQKRRRVLKEMSLVLDLYPYLLQHIIEKDFTKTSLYSLSLNDLIALKNRAIKIINTLDIIKK